MSGYFANKFISPYLLMFLLFFWVALLLFGVYFWEYDGTSSLVGFVYYVSFMVSMIIVTYREVQQAKKRIYDKKLLLVTRSSFQIENNSSLLASDKKFLKLSTFTFWAISMLLIPSAILFAYNMVNGIEEYDGFLFLVFGLFLMSYIFKDIQLIRQRILST